ARSRKRCRDPGAAPWFPLAIRNAVLLSVRRDGPVADPNRLPATELYHLPMVQPGDTDRPHAALVDDRDLRAHPHVRGRARDPDREDVPLRIEVLDLHARHALLGEERGPRQ